MEEGKVWRVTFKYGYIDLAFDFVDVNEASNFIITAGKTFNKEASDDHKDLYMKMNYLTKEDKTDDD